MTNLGIDIVYLHAALIMITCCGFIYGIRLAYLGVYSDGLIHGGKSLVQIIIGGLIISIMTFFLGLLI